MVVVRRENVPFSRTRYIINKPNTRVTAHFTAGSYRAVFKNHSHYARNAQNAAREYPQIRRHVSYKHNVQHYCAVPALTQGRPKIFLSLEKIF